MFRTNTNGKYRYNEKLKKSAAENKAEDVAKEVANERMERFIMQQGSSAQTLRDAGPPVASKAEAPHDATAVSGGE